jgi:UTP--glucose-1-phosphate uridylyltransferase
MTLLDDVHALSPDLLRRLEARGFREDRLARWAASIGTPKDVRNRLDGVVEPPRPGDVIDAPAPGTPEHAACHARGLEIMRRGELALVVLAGGMATRMGGVVKALVEALPGKTFLDLRLAEQAHNAELGANVPLFLMTSEATHGPIVSALGARHDGKNVAAFEQCVSLRLTKEGGLFRDDDGDPSVYATGHGDLPEAFAASGLLDAFMRSTGGNGYVWIANLDNLGATVDPAMLGWFAGRGERIAVEVVDKVGSDKGGVPVVWNGRRIIAEEFRLPLALDPSTIRVFNTNTFLVEAAALRDLDFEFTFVEVDKSVGSKKAVQFERLFGEVTVPIEPAFLRVPREGERSRFLPVKDPAELEQRRAEIELVLRSRGILG